ncbi:S-layer protein [Candidatus Woesearchaeota archaeon]|nr:S-layer protein [Candidatus Woesearchaeota archaeon]
MFVIDKRKNEIVSLPAQEIKASDAKNLSSELAIKILRLLAQKPMYPIELAKELKVHEQKVYYHVRNLEGCGAIKVVKEEERQGATAKYYAAERPAFVVKLKELEATQKIFQMKGDSEFLEPFIADGKLNALIIVGSPDPHGPEKARSRDGYYGMDLALFLGTFLNYVPATNVKLDTEVRDKDLKNNLIIIGGPIVNKITSIVNAKLPVRFEEREQWAIKSTITGNSYPSDESGLIVKAKNPFNPDKRVLVVSGKRHSGTRAAIIAFLKHFREIVEGNLHEKKIKAKVVEGIDLDSDGIVDDVEIRE